MMRDRAWRRAQRARRMHWARDLVLNIWGASSASLAEDPVWLGRMVQTRKPCSCMGCGHRRLWDGPPRQERRALDSFHEVCPPRIWDPSWERIIDILARWGYLSDEEYLGLYIA